MLGLIIKDCLALKKYMRTIFFISAFYIVWGFTMDNVSMIGTMLTLLFSMMIITSFYYDDAAKWDAYALTMPLTRKDIITSKYILSLVMIIMGSLLSLISSVVLTIIKKEPLTEELFMVLGIMLGVAFLFQSFTIPTIVKLGTEKARIAMVVVFLTPTILVFGISSLDLPKPSPEFLHMLELYLPWVAGVTILILYIISYFVTVAFMEKKEI